MWIRQQPVNGCSQRSQCPALHLRNDSLHTSSINPNSLLNSPNPLQTLTRTPTTFHHGPLRTQHGRKSPHPSPHQRNKKKSPHLTPRTARSPHRRRNQSLPDLHHLHSLNGLDTRHSPAHSHPLPARLPTQTRSHLNRPRHCAQRRRQSAYSLPERHGQWHDPR